MCLKILKGGGVADLFPRGYFRFLSLFTHLTLMSLLSPLLIQTPILPGYRSDFKYRHVTF